MCRPFVSLLLALVLACLGTPSAGASTPHQSGPPQTGAGSTTSYLSEVKVKAYGAAGEPGGFVLYEPAGLVNKKAPVVAYLHGAQGRDERRNVDAQLRHYAGKGYTVIYAEEGTTETAEYENAGRAAIAAGLAQLNRRDEVHPDGHLAFVGFSLGGVVAARIASTADGNPPLPRPQLVVLHDAAGERTPLFSPTLKSTSLRGLADARLLLIQAATSVGHPNSSIPWAWENSRRFVPRPHRNWLVVPSDDHGIPHLVSNHEGPTGRRGGDAGLPTVLGPPLDMVDWWGYWRPTEDALAQVFGRGLEGRYDVFCSGRSAGCDPVRDMGRWSDGKKVAPIRNAGDLGHDD